MNGTTVFGGSAGTGGKRGRGGAVAPGDRGQVEVSPSFVIKLMQRWRRHGTLRPERIGGHKRAKLAAHAERVPALLAAEPDLTIAELRHRLADEGIATSRSGIGRFLIAAGLTRKKRPSTPPSRTARTSPRPGPPGAPSSRR
jgi:transposase